MDIEALLNEIETEFDWPEEAVSIKQIEKSLSCAICHGTMKAAVMLSKCGHSFCSYCIRQYLYTDQSCPLCKKQATESDIVKNIAVIEIADVFRENRKELLKLCQRLFTQSLPPMTTRMPDDSLSKTTSCIQDPISNHESAGKRLSSKSESSFSKDVVSLSDSDSDSIFEDEPAQKKPKFESSLMCECPICGEFFSQDVIESHASSCDGTVTVKHPKRFTGFVASPAISKPLPNLCYRLMKTQDIKKQLQKYSLSTTGSRETLIERHRQFTLRYNAELDNQHPMPAWKIAQIIMANEEHSKHK